MIRVLIVLPEALRRTGIKTSLRKDGSIVVIGTGANLPADKDGPATDSHWNPASLVRFFDQYAPRIYNNVINGPRAVADAEAV